jgi:fructokinase
MPHFPLMPAVVRLSSRSLPFTAAPISVGAGFLALDLLLIGKESTKADEQYAGGSCGNVLSILSHLGWDSYPVARLGTDRLAQNVLDDLEHSGVSTEFVFRSDTGITPVIVIRIAEKRDGSVGPKFEWKDPVSGEWLPRYRPFPKTKAAQVTPDLPKARIFYFDRAEQSALVMANAMREKGAVVFFEPSSCKHDDLFTECLAVSDIVKYSAERISKIPRNPISKSPRLEIQTLGQTGLRYRLKMGTTSPGEWRTIPAYIVEACIDSTGCGDWCSAGIIDKLCQHGQNHFLGLGEDEIVKALCYGQALAAVNCQYHGARGPMYHLTHRQFTARVGLVLASLDRQRLTATMT